MSPAELSSLDLLALAAMVFMTFLMRAGGYWVMAYIQLTPMVRRMLDALPGSIVAAIVVPVVVKIGPVAALAVVAAAAVMVARRNAFIAVAAGMLAGALARSAGI